MKIIESDDYRNIGEGAALNLRGGPDDNPNREVLERQKRRAEAHGKIERATGIRFAVVKEGKPGVAGFLEVGNIKAHVAEESLDDADFALKVAHHEKGHERHVRQGINDISLEKNLADEELKALDGFMRTRGFDIEDIDLLEGFNEFGTAREHGVNEDCAYNRKEVPAAMLLEDMCMRDTGRSLLAAFREGDMDLFYELLRSLCAIIKMREEFKMAA